MSEDEAKSWIAGRFGEAALARLARFVSIVEQRSHGQNLIATSTVPNIWRRHVLDSAQLVPLASRGHAGSWLDIGTGAGFPGVVIALLVDRPVTLCEPRRLRASFLSEVVEHFDLATRVEVVPARVSAVHRIFDVISGRAVASVCDFIRLGRHCAAPHTLWLLPRGRAGWQDVKELPLRSQFHVEPSLTDPEAAIIVADNVA